MPERPAPTHPTLGISLLALLCVGVALWPFAAVVQRYGWLMPILLVAATVIVIGALLRRFLLPRRRHLRAALTVVVQVLVATLLVTWLLVPMTAWLWAIPTQRSLQTAVYFFGETASSVWFGSAPLPPSAPLTFVLTVTFAIVAIMLDTLLAYDRSVLAAVTVAAIGAAPMVITRSRVDLLWFLLFSLLVLLLLRRSATREPRAPRRSPLSLTATVGAAAILITLFFAPSLPLSAQGFGPTAHVVLNPTLDLGDDLRQQRSFDVVTLATDAARPPYLRIATLSDFDGDVWAVDELDTHPVSAGFGPTDLPDDLPTQSTSIRVQDVTGSWLPVPYPAIAASGLSDDWRAMLGNRSIVSPVASPVDQDYTIRTVVVDPTLEDMRRDRRSAEAAAIHTALPADLPPHVAALARDVTADARTDYDRLAALQSWFRTQFRYSLSTPVEEGFDGSGAAAVGAFLEVREGYCVHFAAAFALMARSLDIPTRIVVGFLPGSPTGEHRGDETLYAVKSDDLHAWPEAHFERWGWIPFEPTATLGTPTRFSAVAERSENDASSTDAAATDATGDIPDVLDIDRSSDDSAAPTGPLPPIDLRPLLGVAAGLVLVSLVPLATRLARRRNRMARAARGDVEAAWTELTDALVDLRIPVSDAETPRARGIRLCTAHGADAASVTDLVAALEQAGYAPGPRPDLEAPLRRVIRRLTRDAPVAERLAALLLPRSLLPAVGGR